MGKPAGFKGAGRWDGVTLRSGYVEEIVRVRDQLADDAKEGRWPDVLELLGEQRWWVNSSRLGATVDTRRYTRPRGTAPIPSWSSGCWPWGPGGLCVLTKGCVRLTSPSGVATGT
jgi:hypothetical protein